MKHYPHHIGDFDKATRHLTRIERSVYRDLIELYYDTEQQLPLDVTFICRRIIARSNEESTAVEQTLNEFFTKTATGWYHERCEAELEHYRSNNSQKAQAGKASAAARALKKQHALNTRSTHVGTCVEQTSNGTPTNQEPVTSNQEPVVEQPAPKARRKQQYPADFYPSETGLAAATAKGIAVHLELEKFRDYHQAKGNTMADWQAAWRTWVGNARTAIRPAESFAERDERKARERFAAFTGSARADVIDITPTQQRITA